MFRAITLVELLVAVSIFAISVHFFSPKLFHLQDTILVNNEIDQLKSFLYQVQTRARYQKQNYLISISQDSQAKKWCVLAVAKKSANLTACNCLDLSHCTLDSDAAVYWAKSSHVSLASQSFYPKTFLNIDGKTGQQKENCLTFVSEHYRQKLQFESTGVINVPQPNKRSLCD